MQKRLFFIFLLAFGFTTLSFAESPAQLTVQVAPALTTSVPQGAERLSFLTLTLSASCSSDVTVFSMTIHHSGLGNVSDLLRVYALEGYTRLTRGSVLHAATKTATLLFTAPLRIRACTKRMLTIAADVSPTAAAASEHSLSITSASDLSAGSATVAIMQRSTPQVVQVTPATPQSLSVTFLDIPSATILFGSSRTIARLRLSSDSSHDQLINAITFTNDGSASNTDLQDLFLTSSANTILTRNATSLTGSAVRLVFSPPLRLTAHESVVLQLKATVSVSRRKTIRMTIEEPSDIEAADASRALHTP